MKDISKEKVVESKGDKPLTEANPKQQWVKILIVLEKE